MKKLHNRIKVTGLAGLLGIMLGALLAGCESTPKNLFAGEETDKPYYLGPTKEELAKEKIFPLALTNENVVSIPEIGDLITVSGGTTVRERTMPYWADHALAVAAFERPGGKMYWVLVYTREEDETLLEWGKRSETGDAYLSPRTVETRNGKGGYAYETNDHGFAADVHITIPTEQYVYVFRSDETRMEIPQDFINFINETEVE